jgi:DNA-binding CsgD family transcriptional regulator
MHSANDAQLHDLIDRIYASAVRPEVWRDVIRGVSELFGGAPVLGETYLPRASEYPFESVGLQEEYVLRYVADTTSLLPWATRLESQFADRFRPMSDGLPGFELAGSEFYEHWMKPQGLAPLSPVLLSVLAESGVLVASLSVFRREGEGAFSEAEMRDADTLVPHFRRAFRMRMMLDAAHPLGMLVLDGNRQVLMENASAARVLALEDGIEIRSTGLAVVDARENTKLRELIKAARECAGEQGLSGTSFMQVSRPSGQEPFSVMISPLLSAPVGALSSEAVVACFISDPEAGHVPTLEALGQIYGLTPAEAEVAQSLAKGMSLEEIAADRGISLNTVRSHLKHIFSKTGTSRQGELLSLVMTGVGSIRSQ